jgi:stearoyl-CoA desaturase (delta-9 desaturase)
MTTTLKFRLLHILNHLISFAAIYYAITTETYYWFIVFLISFLWLGIVGVNVSLHRYYSHKSFKTTLLRERILLWSSVFTSLGSPAMWCSVHRLHHITSDTAKDPHNPKIQGTVKTWLGIWKMVSIPKRFITPFLTTNELKFIHNNYFILNIGLLIVLCLIDIRLAGFLYALPAIGCFHGAQAIGVLPHLWGYRRYNITDSSHNNWLASILALGEGWHNNHHANPGRWWQGEAWWELDPPAFMIKHFFMINDKNS